MSEAEPDLKNAGLDIFAGGGEMGERIRSFNWRETPLGPIEGWPQALRTTLRLMLDSRYPMFVWWGRALTVFYNDAYISIPGKRHPSSFGQPAPKVWSEVWDTLGPQADQVLNEGRATWNAELPLIMERNGYPEEVFFTFSYSPIPDDHGGIGGVFCACSEDTERVLGERRLAALRQLAAATADAKSAETACGLAAMVLQEHSRDVSFGLIYLIDPAGRQAYLVSRAGIAPGGPVAPLQIAVEKADDLAAQFWPFQQAVAGQKVKLIDLDQRTALPGGPWPEPAHTAMLLPLTKGSQEPPMGFLIVGASPRRGFDDKYEGFFELVAGSIARAVANARAYEEERKRAEALAELDRAKTEFFSNVSHEFRTPLTLMLGPLQGLLEGGMHRLPEDVRETLSLVHRNGQRLLKLVNTLLDFSRIEAGRMQASYEPTDLAALTVELASVFRSAVEKAGLRLVVECPPLPEPAYVDREMWEKIVLNLLSNAFKFTFAGEIKVALRWCGERIELSVSDTGVGIPEQELSRVFERFHQVRGARSRTHEGTGIGLSLVQELARLHGGEVQAHSREREGTTFIVSIQTGKDHLPAERVGAERTAASTGMGATAFVEEAMRWLPGFDSEAAGGRETQTSFPSVAVEGPQSLFPWSAAEAGTHRARILLADDNADMREYVSRLLAERYEVEAVSDGQAALAAACERPPDLVLTDAMMPRLDGFELLRELRSRENTRTIPIIMLSARAGQEALVEGLGSGADDYLIKPFSARELMARVKSHLEMARLRRESVERERQHAAELEKMVAERTARLQEAVTELEGFSYSITHDMRAPLRAMEGFARILELEYGSQIDGMGRNYLQRISVSACRLDELIEDVLNYSKIVRQELRLVPVNVEQLLQDILASYPNLQPPQVDIKVESPLPTVLASVAALTQVISNLLSNSVKFVPSGVKPVVRIRAETRPDEKIRLWFEDNGIGIAREAQQRIFGMFQRLNPPGHYEGTGIGLTIVRKAVERMGGTVGLESQPDRGTRFWVELKQPDAS